MVQNNKILTVSYGTFSCTLEGFDDAFGTMKAIAEYFRDLAAEDRYFGAEPPQPDADMLAHIAQKEIARRVEAHRDETGIVLRASDATAAAQVAAPEPETAQPETEAAAPTALSQALMPAQDPTPAAEVDTPVETEVDGETDEAGETGDAVAPPASEDAATDTSGMVGAAAIGPLAAAIAAVAHADETEDAPAVAEDAVAPHQSETPVEPELAAPSDDTVAETDAEDTAQDALADIVAPDVAPEPDVLIDEEAEAEDIADIAEANVEEPEAEIEDTAQPADDSIAAKLQRIRAVVSQGSSAPQTQDFNEDEHAEPLSASAAASLSDMIADETDTEDTAPADIVAEDSTSDTVDALAAVLAENSATEEVDEAEETSEMADESSAPSAPVQAKVVKVSREEFDAILAADRGEDTAEPAESALSAEDEADLLRELAEVEAEFAPEPEAAVQDDADDLGDVEAPVDEAEEDTQTAEAEPAPIETKSAAQDDADEDEIGSIFAEDESDADTASDKEADDFAEERAILSGDVDDEPDATRIMEEADSKLSDPETSDRRSEFAHLRAAMAAGKAEEAAGGSISDTESDGAYREDLARAVRPQRVDSRPRPGRPHGDKPAPLKLVAAQRVDAQPAAPVQPRRVMSAPLEETMEDGADGKMKFADYAEGVGAVELPDLLEAAAAYLSFVEGQEQFSRPQLMTKVRMVETEEFSREDGLRSFGLLLRDGKIEKTQAGRFTVSDRIGFRPEDMREAG